jgi:tRNA dimethylallyltransferase
MIEKGFINEVLNLKSKYTDIHLPAMQTIGYKQINEYFDGIYSLDVMKNKILYATRQLAKRQITWLRHLDGTTVYTFVDYDNIKSRVNNFLENT